MAEPAPPQPQAPAGLPSASAIASAVADEGYCVLPALLTPDEVQGIRSMLESEDGPRKYAYRGTTKMASFPHPGDDVLGRIARSRRLHAIAAAAIGLAPETQMDESGSAGVQLHHVQAVFKEKESHYAFAWHQDYGYHYHGGVLRPRMCTLVVAVDPCLPENGGLEILARSHTCGRLDHRPQDSRTRQLTADPDRMALLLNQPHRFPLRPLSLQPGDAVVFHCLTLHRSGPNTSSGLRRYALNITYNARDNLPVPDAATAGDMDEGQQSPPPLPYEVVVDDGDVLGGGVEFRHVEWGVPFIPPWIHRLLEAWRDGRPTSGVEVSVVDGRRAMVIEDSPAQFSSEEREGVAFKCQALKLEWRVGEDGRVLVLEPLPPPPEG